jgi:hypothetical protein
MYCNVEEIAASVKITVFASMDYRRVKIPQSGETNHAETELYRVQHAKQLFCPPALNITQVKYKNTYVLLS